MPVPRGTPPWPAAMTIAGSDSGGGAGIQADLKTFAALGAFGTSAITAVTAQNTAEVREALPLPPDLVVNQISAIMDDIKPRAAKTGMLANAAIIRAISIYLADTPDLALVVDPVAFSSTGFQLLADDALAVLRDELIPQARLVTPNLREAAAQSGIEIHGQDDMRRAGEIILSQGAKAVLVKGGHLEDTADDLFLDGTREEWLRAERVETENNHGTGCSLSAGITAGLARGLSLLEAIKRSKAFVHQGLVSGYSVGAGRSPINHFHEFTAEIERMYL